MIMNFRCVEEYKTPYPHSIIFHKGENVLVGVEYDQDLDWKGWIRCRGTKDQVAWIPEGYLQIKKSRGTLIREYDARELNLRIDEIVKISEIVNGFGIAENQNGEIGWVPMNHLEPLSSET